MTTSGLSDAARHLFGCLLLTYKKAGREASERHGLAFSAPELRLALGLTPRTTMGLQVVLEKDQNCLELFPAMRVTRILDFEGIPHSTCILHGNRKPPSSEAVPDKVS